MKSEHVCCCLNTTKRVCSSIPAPHSSCIFCLVLSAPAAQPPFEIRDWVLFWVDLTQFPICEQLRHSHPLTLDKHFYITMPTSAGNALGTFATDSNRPILLEVFTGEGNLLAFLTTTSTSFLLLSGLSVIECPPSAGKDTAGKGRT